MTYYCVCVCYKTKVKIKIDSGFVCCIRDFCLYSNVNIAKMKFLKVMSSIYFHENSNRYT